MAQNLSGSGSRLTLSLCLIKSSGPNKSAVHFFRPQAIKQIWFSDFFEDKIFIFFKAKCIVNKAKINEEQEAATIRELQKEIEQLKMTKTMGIEKVMLEKAEIEAEIEKLKQTQENSQKFRPLMITKFFLNLCRVFS